MYLTHFHLQHQPFAEHTDVTRLWQDTRMDEGLARLDHLVNHGLLGLLTGASGLGKSALLKRFLHGLTPQRCEVAYCHQTHLSSLGLLKLLLTQLGEEPKHYKDQVCRQILARIRRVEGTLLLVFDEAHLLNADALTDLRLLISSALADGPPLKILLAGQESLRLTLKRVQHTDFMNRVSVRVQLRPLTKEQTLRYIDFQIVQAGGDARTFDDSAKSLIHDFTGGVPRHINNMATACLLQAAARQLTCIDEQVFQQAAGEFQLS
jgi:general secretion pathway protein A